MMTSSVDAYIADLARRHPDLIAPPSSFLELSAPASDVIPANGHVVERIAMSYKQIYIDTDCPPDKMRAPRFRDSARYQFWKVLVDLRSGKVIKNLGEIPKAWS